ncbi:hypothetical protein K488DRAFT_88869 [Vararia minispora EC-137]|uniref:Uncharacterized protein n=1 Tax=Vararia minispora EC-137 TaxID=1314806 RepID=A0ACB8QCE9_9AGAM|nr:hypothetical protein K488DRAFT_88869 [Vararia minispora EC-137]
MAIEAAEVSIVPTVFASDACSVYPAVKAAFPRRCPRRAVIMNLDTLSCIQSFLDRPTLVTSMLTCSDLYASGVRSLLQFDIILRCDASIRSFSAFLNRDRRTRLYLLRNFSLNFCETTAFFNTVKALLIDILTHSLRLEKLRLGGCISSLGDDNDVVARITALQHLRELHIHVSRDNAPSLLSDLQAPVEKLDIHVLDDLGDPWEAMPMVTRFSSSLEELCLSALVTLTSIRSSAVFPKMRRLSLNGAYFRHVGPLVAAFPNLDELYVAYAHLHTNEIEDARAANQHAQKIARWRRLDDLSGVLRALYVAAITSDVYRMSIQLVDCLESDVHRLSIVLVSARPRVLHLDFLLRVVHSLPAMIPPSERLIHLRLSINMAACTPDTSSGAILDGLYELVRQQTKLEHLFLRVFCCEWSTSDQEAYNERIIPFRGMVAHEIVQAFAVAVPSLRQILVLIEPNATLLSPDGNTMQASDRFAWTVDLDGSVRTEFEVGSQAMSTV